jgi:hypothetical protein
MLLALGEMSAWSNSFYACSWGFLRLASAVTVSGGNCGLVELDAFQVGFACDFGSGSGTEFLHEFGDVEGAATSKQDHTEVMEG